MKLIKLLPMISLLLAVSILTAAAAKLSVNPVSVDDNSIVTVSGNVTNGTQLYEVGIVIKSPDGSVNHVNSVDTDNDGLFTYLFRLKGPSSSKDNKYIVTAGAYGVGSESISFDYLALDDRKNVLEAFNTASDISVIDTYSIWIKPNEGLLTAVKSNEAVKPIADAALAATKFDSFESLADSINKMLLFSLLKSAKSASDFTDTAIKYKDIFDFYSVKSILQNAKLFDEEKLSNTLKSLYGTVGEESMFDGLCESYKSIVFAAAMQNVPNKDGITEIITDFSDEIAACGSSAKSSLAKYNALEYSAKTEINGKILALDISDVGSLGAAFPDLFDTAPTSTGKVTGGSSGGTGASKSTYTMTPAAVVQQEETTVGFDDLDGFEWAAESIMALQKAGIINGRTEKSFEPNAQVSRAEFIKMLMLAVKADGAGVCDFADVDRKHWAYVYISSAFGAGLITGNESNEFLPDNSISRQDAAVVICRAVKAETGSSVDFADADTISDYAIGAVAAIKKLGLINGFEDNTFRPNESLTRAQAAKIIYDIISGGII